MDKKRPPDVRPESGHRFGDQVVSMIQLGETYTCQMEMAQQTHSEIHLFSCVQGVALPQTLASYISDRDRARWNAYESKRIAGWVTVRVDVMDGG